MQTDELNLLCDKILRGALPAEHAKIIRSALERGVAKKRLLATYRKHNAGPLAMFAVEAEIDAIQKEIAARIN